MKRHILAALSLILSLAAPLAAQPVPAGPEIPLDDAPKGSFSTVAAVAANGSFLAVWNSQAGGIRTRAFSPSGAPLAPASEIRPGVNAGPETFGTNPRAAALAGGGYVAVWENEPPIVVEGAVHARLEAALSYSVSFRLLNALGQPAGPEVLVTQDGSGASVAPLPSGGFLLAWGEPGGVFARRFDAQGQPTSEKLSLPVPGAPYDVALLPDGAFALVWGDLGVQQKLYLRIFAPDATPRSTAVQVSGTDHPHHTFPQLSSDGTGRLLATWSSRRDGEWASQRARLFSSTGAPLGAEIVVDPEQKGYGYGDASLRADGSFLAAWQTSDFKIRARVFAADGTPQGEPFLVHTLPNTHHRPDVATTPGGWLVSWTAGIVPSAPYARLFQLPASACTGLCLNGNRFRVEVSWRVPATGAEGAGTPIPLTGDTGAFWFFSPSNYELVVKVLDGTAINGHFWVFYGSLTDVEFDLTVTDVLTGEQRAYHNPAGTMASHADTQAF